MHKNWRWNLHGHLSLLPFTLLYAVACFLIYRGRRWSFRSGVLTCVGPRLGTLIPRTGAQTIGACQVYASEMQRAREDLHVHENGHIGQQMFCAFVGLAFTPIAFAALGWSPAWGLVFGGFLGTPLWGLAYIATFFVLWAKRRRGWRDAYRASPFERECFDVQADFLSGRLVREKVWK